MSKISLLREKTASVCDAVIISDSLTRYYLTGFHSTDGLLFVTAKTALLLADFRYIEAAKEAVASSPEITVLMPEGSFTAAVAALIADEDIKTVGFLEDTVTVAGLEGMKKAYPGVEFVHVSSIIRGMRELKTDDEFACITHAQSIADAALAELLANFDVGASETEIALELEYKMRRRGASGVSFETICVSGAASSRPHGVPENRPLERGFLTMDFGCIYNGYCSDMTRTVSVGKATPEMKRLYATVLEAQTAALAAVAEGKLCSDIDKVARDIIYGAGYTGCFGHGLGHGVGLEIHEAPTVSPRGTTVLARGHVITIEPGIYIAGKYGARIEDMVCMTSAGPVDICHSPKELIEIY